MSQNKKMVFCTVLKKVVFLKLQNFQVKIEKKNDTSSMFGVVLKKYVREGCKIANVTCLHLQNWLRCKRTFIEPKPFFPLETILPFNFCLKKSNFNIFGKQKCRLLKIKVRFQKFQFFFFWSNWELESCEGQLAPSKLDKAPWSNVVSKCEMFCFDK